MARSTKQRPGWAILDMDTMKPFNPPYPFEDAIKISFGGTISETQIFGMQDPIIQWTCGKAKRFTFSSVLFSEDPTDVIQGKFEDLTSLSEMDEKLGRPHICILSAGKVFSEMVMLESVDVDIMPLNDDGSPRRINFSLSCVKYRPFSQLQIDPTKPTKECYYLIASSAEASYEALARRFYGNPYAGDRLRKRHPDMPMQPTAGSKIKIPPKSLILKETVQPSFHALNLSDQAAMDNFAGILDHLAERKVLL